jgi:predicted AAA+ superfamily ATPase
VLGARQTGKSTLFTMLKNSRSVLIDLQERSERTRFSREPDLLSRRLLALGKRRAHVLIDEIQRVPELLDEIQLVSDRRADQFTFTLTGGSARKLRRGSANTLPGRAHLFHLGPVTLWGQTPAEEHWVLPAPVCIEKPFPKRGLESLLVFGSLPANWTEKTSFGRTLESYAGLYLEEEIEREALVRGIGRFGNFLQLAALESGKTVNLAKISQESGIAVSTIQGFYPILEDTLAGFRLFPYSRSRRIRILKTPKFYLLDVGVRNALARVALDKRLVASEGGFLLEHWVACELAARIAYLGRAYRLSYWRSLGGAEVDFVLETPRETIPIEVKYTANPRPRDAAAIEHFITLYPHVKRGVVICRVKEAEKLTQHVTAVPWDQL